MTEKNSKPGIQVTDRRFWVVNENAEEEAAVPADSYPSFVEELKARADRAEQKLRERVEELSRENDAYRARLRQDLERRAELRTGEILSGFLEIIDNFERALEVSGETSLEALREGLELNLQLLVSKLSAQGIEPLCLKGQPYDPELAEAVGTVPVSDPEEDGIVIDELQTGYRFGDQLLRPARVRIGSFFEAGQGGEG